MKAIQIKTRPRDGFEASELIETVRSPGYIRIAHRLQHSRAGLIAQLLVAPTWDAVLGLQAGIRSIDTALDLPEILRREDTAAMKRNPT